MNELDRRSESIERQALLSLHEHCPRKTRDELGLFLEEVGDALVAGASRDPSILLNRTLGLGLEEPITRDAIEAIDAIYRERGVEGRYFVHVYEDALADGPETFRGTRLQPARGWMKFQRGTASPPSPTTTLDVRRVGPGEADAFGAIIARAFGMTEAAGPLLAGLAEDRRWHCFQSADGDQPAGAGALMIVGDSAWLEWGATAPDFRRRGSQGAIMAARIEAARRAGCTAMFTETGEASGEDPQHSYGNIERYGFTASILRHNWSPPDV